jgi:hypothetical protein
VVLTYLLVGEEAKRGVRALKGQSELFEPQAAPTRHTCRWMVV